MEWIPCTQCGKPVRPEGHWDGFARILCEECCRSRQQRVRKCWECGYYARDDYAGYCRRCGDCCVDGEKDACQNFSGK